MGIFDRPGGLKRGATGGTRRRSGKRIDRRTARDSLAIEPLESRALLAITVVDPVDGQRLTSPVVLGEWSSSGDYESWTVAHAAGSGVSDGVLTVTAPASGSPVQIVRQDAAAGPNLDRGSFDFLQARLKLPEGFAKDVIFSFGTDTRPGFAADRSFTIPAAQVAADGQWHTYRVDVGLEVWWRDTLQDLRIQPVGGLSAGETVQVDYVEVGDLPGDTLTAYTASLNMAPGVTEATRRSIESKHFVFWWDPAVNPGGRTDFADSGHRALRMLEESYQVYVKVLGLEEPFRYAGDGLRHKINLTTWYGGYWMGGPSMNVDTSGLADENWGNPVPHEFGHVIDSQQAGFLAGGHWESHANFLREAWVNWYAPLFDTHWQSTVDLSPLAWSNYHQDMKRLIYADYRVFTALQHYDADPTLGTRLWSEGLRHQSVYDKVAALLPAGTSVQDVIASTMRRWPMLDFKTRDPMRARLWATPLDRATFDWRTGAVLLPLADQPGWWQVPLERAPEKYAYMVHELSPTGSSVTVTLRGIATIDPTQDWRWSLAAIDGAGNVRYGDLWTPGTHTFTLEPGENRLQLFVMATPGDTSLDLESFFNTKPIGRHIDRLQYPYEVRIVGATPVTGAGERFAAPVEPALGRPHPNGGGWVSNMAFVAATAYVGPNARVLDGAEVTGKARIEDYAVVREQARITESAVVSGYSVVQGGAVVRGNARIRDHALVGGWNTVVQDAALVEGYASLDGATVKDSAIVRGNAFVWAGTLSGTAIADYDYSYAWSFSDGVHFGHYPWGDWFGPYYDSTLTKPRGLVASYRIDEPSGQLLWDEFGAEQAVLRGAPTRVPDATMRSQVLQLDGAGQYALLGRGAADLRTATYGMWVYPSRDRANETLLYFGSGASEFLKLVARDGTGAARLTISVGGRTETLRANVATPLNRWTHVAVTIGGGRGTIFINGVAAGSAALRFRPTDVLGPNDSRSAEPLYLGRGAAGGFFTGRLEDVRVYNVPLTRAEIVAEAARRGSRLGQFFTAAPATFDGGTTARESGVRTGLERTLSAWINPRVADAGQPSAPVIDSRDERSGRTGNGFGIAAGRIVVQLDDSPPWDTGIRVRPGVWQHVAVAFNGTAATVFVNGVATATTTYAADVGSLPSKNYRIGYSQATEDAATRSFFDGQIYDLRIEDRMAQSVAPSAAGIFTKAADVGSPRQAGSTAFAGGSYTLVGGGTGFAGRADAFQFASTALAGDGSIVVRIASLQAGVRAGLMIRDATAANARYVGLVMGPDGGVTLQARTKAGGAVGVTARATAFGPVWLKLTRLGNTFTAFYSTSTTSPSSWTQLGSAIALGLAVGGRAGVAVSSGTAMVTDVAIDHQRPW